MPEVTDIGQIVFKFKAIRQVQVIDSKRRNKGLSYFVSKLRGEMNQGYFRTFWMIPAVICGMVALGLAACSQSDRTIAPINSPEPRLTVHNIKIPNPPLETTRSIKATVRSGPSLMVSPTPGTSPTMMLTKTNVPGATPVKSQRTVYPTPRVTSSAVQTTTESGLYQDPVSAVFSDLAGRLALPVNHMNLVSQAPT